MAITHKGYTTRQIADAVAAVILSADPGAEVIPQITRSFKNDDEKLDASRDEKSYNVNRWDIHAYNDGKQRTSEPLACDGTLKVDRKIVATVLLKFRYSVGKDEFEIDDQNKTSYDRFMDREEAVEYQFSATPFLLTGALHGEMQTDKRDMVGFHREDAYEGSYRLQVTYRDSVTKTE